MGRRKRDANLEKLEEEIVEESHRFMEGFGLDSSHRPHFVSVFNQPPHPPSVRLRQKLEPSTAVVSPLCSQPCYPSGFCFLRRGQRAPQQGKPASLLAPPSFSLPGLSPANDSIGKIGAGALFNASAAVEAAGEAATRNEVTVRSYHANHAMLEHDRGDQIRFCGCLSFEAPARARKTISFPIRIS